MFDDPTSENTELNPDIYGEDDNTWLVTKKVIVWMYDFFETDAWYLIHDKDFDIDFYSYRPESLFRAYICNEKDVMALKLRWSN